MDAAQSLITERGFSGTTLDAILANSEASKGAFFHHFASKDALGDALLDRYAAGDAEVLETYMARAEELSDDPAEQVVLFVRLFEETADDFTAAAPGCLFVSFLYERGPESDRNHQVIAASVELWRALLLSKLELAAEGRPELVDVDLVALADQVFSTFEGGYILVRATDDPSQLGRQLAHLRRYLELLLKVDARSLATS